MHLNITIAQIFYSLSFFLTLSLSFFLALSRNQNPVQ